MKNYINKNKNILKFVAAPLLIAFAIFYFVPSIFAQSEDEKVRMSQFLAEGSQIETGKEVTGEGVGQIYYTFEGNKKIITGNNFAKGDPVTNNGYIVWIGQTDGLWQVYLYNTLTDTTLQLTRTGNNTNPTVSSSGKVVWEGWVDDAWQVFAFDGTKIRQITQGDLSVRPYIEGDYIVYAKKDAGGLWRSEAYSLKDDRSVTIDVGNETEYPKLENGDIYVGPPRESQKKYPLKIEDLFLLDLDQLNLPAPTSAPKTEGDVRGQSIEVTESTGSAELLPEGVDADLQTPSEASQSGNLE